MDKAYLVLLNGLRSSEELSESSLLRLEKLLAIWDHHSWVVLSTGYTRYKPPPLDERGFVVTESRVAARELVTRGVQRSKILSEELSADTIGNLYFTMTLFVQPLNIRSISIVTSEFHVDRAEAAMNWICSLSGWQTVPTVQMERAPNPRMPIHMELLLRLKEAQGCRNIEALRHQIRCVSDMCVWLQMEHDAYRLEGKVTALPPALLQAF